MSTIKVNAFQNTSGASFYPSKAWINYNGTTATIRDDGNHSSVTDNAVGGYTFNLSNAFSTANYAPVMVATDEQGSTGSYGYAYGCWVKSVDNDFNTSNWEINIGYPANNLRYDQEFVFATVVGDL